MGRLLAAAAAAAFFIASHGAQADEREVLESLKFQSGTIPLGDNLASLTLSPNFQYLSPADAKRFLVEVWGNPPGSAEGTLGAIMPANVDPLGGEGWAIIITYDDSGHVSDDDAAGINYDDLLKDMQKATREYITYSRARKANPEDAKRREGEASSVRITDVSKTQHMKTPPIAYTTKGNVTISYQKSTRQVAKVAEALGNASMSARKAMHGLFGSPLESSVP
jgi:hypothetical protein